MSLLSSLPSRKHPARQRADGSTLPATMMTVAVILAFLSAAAYLTSQDARFTNRQDSKSDLLTAGDAALDYAYGEWKSTTASVITGNTNPIPMASTWPAATLLNNFNKVYANSGAFAANTNVNVTNLSISGTDQNGIAVSDSTAPPAVPTNNVPGYPGWNGSTYYYSATATISSNGHYGVYTGGGSSDNAVTVKRYFQVTQVPLFQAAIFYENNLELHPGAKMVITGLVHSNQNIYALGYLANLQFMSNVSYVGSYQESSNPAVRYGWDGSNTSASNVPDTYAAYFPDYWADGKPSSTSATRSNQVNQVSTIDPFGGAKQTNNGLIDIITVPKAGSAYSEQIAYDNASLIITIDSSQPANSALRYVITDGSGNNLTGVDRVNVINALTTTAPTTITDQRETATVTVTSLDMAKLAYATVPTGSLNYPASGNAEFATQSFPVGVNSSDLSIYGGTRSQGTTFQKAFKGTVYIHDVAPTSASTRTAIRLVNGRSLGQDVSVASDNGMYIQGDYNTGGSSSSDVPTDGTGTSPQATNYSRHSSSVMADAVTILSNNWSDNNSGAALNSRMATATTVNTAILAGDVPSNANGDGIASGGAHNFPRFLENWNNINFTYYGSLVEAFHSAKFTGNWQTNNVYHWPNRLWNFDTVFLQKQPPGVPQGISFSRGRYERVTN